MKEFNEEFRTRLYEIINEIENNSLVEIVAIIREKSDDYKDVGYFWAVLLTGIAFTVMMLAPVDINPYLIYIITIVSFFLFFFGIMLIPAVLRKLIPKEKIDRKVEIMSRAIFQKGGIRMTETRIGVLFFVSYFEQKVVILPDKGAEMAVPVEEWEKIDRNFQAVFDGNVADNFLKALISLKDLFNQYIPPVENDINELPDDLEVDL